MRKKAAFLAMIGLLLTACGRSELDWSGAKTAREVNFQMDEPQYEELVLRNYSAVPVAFTFQVNGGFFADVKGMVEHVRKMEDATPGESEVRKAWRFASGLTINAPPLNESSRMHHPLLLFNSAGVGYCDDEATALTMIWKEMGYGTRVWKVGGHVVPEVQVRNRWHVYDPSMKVHYPEPNNDAAGIEGLQKDPNLVFSGIKSPPPFYIATLGLSSLTHDIYQTREDNVVDDWYDSIPPAGPGEFRLPPGGSIRISSGGHGYFLEGLPLQAHAYLDLELPDGYTGRQPFPLLVLQVDGDLPEEDAGKLSNHELFLDEMKFDGGGPLRIRCALNSAMIQFREENNLSLMASHPDSLDLEIVPMKGEDLHLRKELVRIRKAITDEKARFAPFQDSLPAVASDEDVRRNARILFESLGEIAPDLLASKTEEVVEIFRLTFADQDKEGQTMLWRVFSEGHIFVHTYAMVKNMASFQPFSE